MYVRRPSLSRKGPHALGRKRDPIGGICYDGAFCDMLHLKPRRRPKLISEWVTERRVPPTRCAGVVATACTQGKLLANLYMRRFVLGWKMLGLEQSLGSRIVTYADE